MECKGGLLLLFTYKYAREMGFGWAYGAASRLILRFLGHTLYLLFTCSPPLARK